MATTAQFKQFGPYFDSSGNLYTLQIYHYAAGTTTLKDGYTTRAKSATVAQPLESDSAGIASAYWDGIYKFRIDGSTDGVSYSTLYTYDNVVVFDDPPRGEGTAITCAATLTLGTDGDYFHVTGSTGPVTAISGTQPHVTLCFDSTPTLTHSASLQLAGEENYTTMANDVFVFVNDGSGVWREVSRKRDEVPAHATIVASTSGTVIDFESFPTGIRRLTIMFVGVSTSGTDNKLIQLGDSGGIESSGYLGASAALGNAAATVAANSTAGLIVSSALAADILHGSVVFELVDKATFSWVGHANLALSNSATSIVSACSKALSAELDRVRITTTSGTDTFDAGSINVFWE